MESLDDLLGELGVGDLGDIGWKRGWIPLGPAARRSSIEGVSWLMAGLSRSGPEVLFVGTLEVEAASGPNCPMGGGLFSLFV